MELWSVCIEETVYWTELANQTIYYIVSNIYLILMAHVTKCPFILRWANGLYFLVHFHFLQSHKWKQHGVGDGLSGFCCSGPSASALSPSSLHSMALSQSNAILQCCLVFLSIVLPRIFYQWIFRWMRFFLKSPSSKIGKRTLMENWTPWRMRMRLSGERLVFTRSWSLTFHFHLLTRCWAFARSTHSSKRLWTSWSSSLWLLSNLGWEVDTSRHPT